MQKQDSIAKLGILAFLLALSMDVRAYNFLPTDSEWRTWPDHCKAKYARTVVGRSSKYAGDIGPTEIAALKPWEDSGIRGLHHYCTGMIWLNRARVEGDPTERAHMLNRGRNETTFTLSRSPRASPYFAPIAVQMTTIMYEQGDFDAALTLLQSMIDAQPRNAVFYSATAVIQRELGHLSEAKETLLKGDKAVNGRSAEISYNLGLICLELGEIEDAQKYAEAAYEMGFPLQGLRSKLEKLGRM